MTAQLIDATLGVGLGAIFLWSALGKLRNSRAFTLQVLEYRVVPALAGHLIARVLPASEMCIALLLITGTAPRAAAAGTMVLVTAFISAITVNLLRGRRIPCGCFGSRGRGEISWALVGQDTVLLIAGAVLVWRAPSWAGYADWSLLRWTSVAPAVVIVLCLFVSGMLGVFSQHHWPRPHSPVEALNRLQTRDSQPQRR